MDLVAPAPGVPGSLVRGRPGQNLCRCQELVLPSRRGERGAPEWRSPTKTAAGLPRNSPRHFLHQLLPAWTIFRHCRGPRREASDSRRVFGSGGADLPVEGGSDAVDRSPAVGGGWGQEERLVSAGTTWVCPKSVVFFCIGTQKPKIGREELGNLIKVTISNKWFGCFWGML